MTESVAAAAAAAASCCCWSWWTRSIMTEQLVKQRHVVKLPPLAYTSPLRAHVKSFSPSN